MESKDNKEETSEERTLEIPPGNNREDIKSREKIISNVYREWYKANPSKAVYNNDLHENINVRFLSITGTIRHASKTYLSTLAVLQLDVILKYAYQVGEPTPIKPGVINQSVFDEMIIMECPLIGIGIGTAKLTVGVKRKQK
jgi:hypothetical protein